MTFTSRIRAVRFAANVPVKAGRQTGFSLLELMIVVAIIGIIVAIAIPSYENSVIKTNRKAVAACMLEVSQFMERFYTTNLRYDQTATATPAAVTLPSLTCRSDLSGAYTIAFQATPTAAAYTVQATPVGRQLAKDTACGVLRIDHTGTKTVTGTLSATPNDCFSK